MTEPSPPPQRVCPTCQGAGHRSESWNDPRGVEFNNAPDSTAGGNYTTCSACYGTGHDPTPLPNDGANE